MATATKTNVTGLTKVLEIEKELASFVYEREDEIRALMIGMLTNQHVLLLGDPGTGKSLLARNFTSHIDGSTLFNYLLSKTTAPEEILGPILLSELENGRYLRKTSNYLPEADFAFLDEIFKANSPLQNALLMILNERIFNNDGQEVPVPLKMMVAASNEIPIGEDEARAFIDRLVMQFWVSPMKDTANQKKMLLNQIGGKSYTPQTTITFQEIEDMQAEVKNINFPDKLVDNFLKILAKLQMGVEVNPDIDAHVVINVSERRRNALVRILQAQAYLEGRTEVEQSDFEILYPALIRARNEKEFAEHKEAVDLAMLEMSSPFERELKKILQEADNLQTKVMDMEDASDKSNAAIDARNTLNKMVKMVKDLHKKAKADGTDLTEQAKLAKEHIDKVNKEIVENCLFVTDVFEEDDDSDLPF